MRAAHLKVALFILFMLAPVAALLAFGAVDDYGRATTAFPPLGKAGHYIGLNEYYWLQIPWFVTALFALWCYVAERRGPLTFGDEWPRRRAETASARRSKRVRPRSP